MTKTPKTGFDRYFDDQMDDPKIRDAYAVARAEIDSTDQLMRTLDELRQSMGLSKAAMARKAGMLPPMVRKLLTPSRRSNPTLLTVLRLINAVGYRIELVKQSEAPPKRTSKTGPQRLATTEAEAVTD